jgi:hypothetical protein
VAEYPTCVAATGEDRSGVEMRDENENLRLTRKMMAERAQKYRIVQDRLCESGFVRFLLDEGEERKHT